MYDAILDEEIVSALRKMALNAKGNDLNHGVNPSSLLREALNPGITENNLKLTINAPVDNGTKLDNLDRKSNTELKPEAIKNAEGKTEETYEQRVARMAIKLGVPVGTVIDLDAKYSGDVEALTYDNVKDYQAEQAEKQAEVERQLEEAAKDTSYMMLSVGTFVSAVRYENNIHHNEPTVSKDLKLFEPTQNNFHSSFAYAPDAKTNEQNEQMALIRKKIDKESAMGKESAAGKDVKVFEPEDNNFHSSFAYQTDEKADEQNIQMAKIRKRIDKETAVDKALPLIIAKVEEGCKVDNNTPIVAIEKPQKHEEMAFTPTGGGKTF